MPLIWRHLLRSYFQFFLLCVSAFIGVLLILRLQEIARFATSGATLTKVLSFALLQVPYILPLTIPISSLIAAMLLFYRLSLTHELTALRSLGLSIKDVAAPIVCAALILSLCNFAIANELAPRCRGKSKAQICEMVTLNPFFLLKKESLIKLKNVYFDMKALTNGTKAQDVVLVIKNSSNEHLTLILAKELKLKGDLIQGKQVSIISSADAKTEGFDHLVIENQGEMNTQAANLSQFTQTMDWATSYDYMPLKQIIAHDLLLGKSWLSKSARVEIARRLSLALATCTFTCLGISCGSHIGRNRLKKKLLHAMSLASFFLICFISAKSLKHAPVLLTTALYLIPHPIILLFSSFSLKSLQRGRE